MSRMQEATFRKGYDCAKPALPVAETCEADTQERSDERYHHKTLGESDCSQLRRSSILWLVRNPPTKCDHPAAERTSRLKSPRTPRPSGAGAWKRSQSRRLSVPRHESVPSQPRQEEGESVAAQIRRFQERADLRECLLPGMLGKVSLKACEGWQHQASLRTSRVLAKMKLDSCQRCQYRLESDAAQV